MSSKRRNQQGFTLVEVIVMMSIVVIGVLATLSVANLAVRSSEANEQRVAAVNLAREGVELVRAIRDSNWAAASEESGTSCWNYFAQSLAQARAVPYTTACDSPMGVPTGTTHFAVYPNVGNGMPYMRPQTVGTTQNAVYRLCRDSATGLYQPHSTVCPSGQTFYRRISIRVGKDLGVDADDGQQKFSYRVQSFVNWAGHDGPDMLVEEYITDWRKP
ncbi:MAG: prepilin-type N-terminal cleavage/methylation domain-containing protein [bacterium]|nr:prepilin-type N-terminal cleavage/methylation domain-containing protein [bacterium]